MSTTPSLPSLEAVLDSVPYSAVALVDREGTYRRIGGVFWAEQGIDAQRDLYGKRIRDLWPEGTADDLHQLLDRALEGEVAEGIVPWEGLVFRVVTTPIAETLGTGDPMVLLFARDVTEQLESDQLFRDVVATVPLGVVATDEQGRITVWNEAASAIVGIPVEQALGGSAETFFDLVGLPADAPVRSAILEARSWEGEAEIMRDGERRIVRMIRTPSGEGRRAVSILRDVTEVRAAAAVAERERRLRSLGRVAGGVAHDFGNLLTAISGRIDLLLEDAGDGDGSRELREIRDALGVAEQLTTRLLTVGDARVEPGSCVPGTVAARMAVLLHRLTASNVTVVMDLPSTSRVPLGSADVEQILLNLVTNSADAMPKGGSVRVSITDADADVMLRVEDQGAGIGPDLLPTIFDPFVSTKPVGKGTGMGLSTVHGLSTAAGGSVVVERTGAEGTSIAIRLPRLDVDSASERLPSGRVEEATSRVRRALVVEDESLVRSLVERTLTRSGCEVVSVGDVAGAREALRESGDFDLVLSDVSLPGVDGITFAAEVRASHPGLPIILMSGNFAQQIDRHGPVPDGVTTLDKPFGLNGLRATLASALGTS